MSTPKSASTRAGMNLVKRSTASRATAAIEKVASEAPSADTAKRMRSVRRRDTKPEIALRRALFARGLRFHVDRRVPIPRVRADIVFPRLRVAVFVDGCFWHACPVHATWPKSNADWWRAKIEGNVRRDRSADEALTAIGWTVVRVWEHESVDVSAKRVILALEAARARSVERLRSSSQK